MRLYRGGVYDGGTEGVLRTSYPQHTTCCGQKFSTEVLLPYIALLAKYLYKGGRLIRFYLCDSNEIYPKGGDVKCQR